MDSIENFFLFPLVVKKFENRLRIDDITSYHHEFGGTLWPFFWNSL